MAMSVDEARSLVVQLLSKLSCLPQANVLFWLELHRSRNIFQLICVILKADEQPFPGLKVIVANAILKKVVLYLGFD